MGLHAVGVGLDQQRAVALAGQAHGAGHDCHQRHQVVAVHAFAGHAVAHGLVGQGRGGGLLGERHGDRVLVVLHEEDHRQVEHRGEVQRFVEVAFTGGAVAAHGDHNGVLPAQLGRVGDAHRVQQLGGQRGGHRRAVVGLRIVPAVPFAAEAGHDFHRGDALGQHGHGVAVGREQPVAFFEAQRGGDLAGFLAVARRVDGHAALAHQGGVLVVDAASGHQGGVGLHETSGARQRVLMARFGALLVLWTEGSIRVQKVDHVPCWQHVVFRGDTEFVADFSHATRVCIGAHVLPPFVVLRRSPVTHTCDWLHPNIICN